MKTLRLSRTAIAHSIERRFSTVENQKNTHDTDNSGYCISASASATVNHHSGLCRLVK